MKRRTVSGLMLTLLLIGMLTLASNVQSVRASGTIYIRADGNIDPPTATIVSADNVTYAFTDNIYEEIEIQRSDIIVDGNGYSLQGFGSGFGVSWTSTNNVSIQNMEITGFSYGLAVFDSQDSTVFRNRVANIEYNAIYLWRSTSTSIQENEIANNGVGINLNALSDDNAIYGNNITGDNTGIQVYSSNNDIYENNFENNTSGIQVSGFDNRIHNNNLTDNFSQGIFTINSANNTISYNNVTNSNMGIRLSNSNASLLFENSMERNNSSLYVEGYQLTHFLHSIDETNSVEGKPVYYLLNQTNLMINASTHPQLGYLGLINCGNVTVEGVTMTSKGQNVLFAYTNNSRVAGNNIENSFYGVSLVSSSNNTVSRNNITSSYFGLYLTGISNSSIYENRMASNEYGILLSSSSNNVLWSNTMIGNKHSFGVIGSQLSHYTNDVDPSNSVDGKPVFLLINEQNHIVDPQTYPDIGFLALINSTNVVVRDITMEHNIQGILFAHSKNSLIQNVSVADNGMGIMLDYCSDINITRNNMTSNQGAFYLHNSSKNEASGNKIANNDFGLTLFYSSNNTVTKNNITNSMVATYLLSSENNTFYHNSFINNTMQVYDVFNNSTNVWDNGYPSGGNYWSDYTGVDLDDDGIGDTPYTIDTENQDNYPLMRPLSPIPGDVNSDGIVDIFDIGYISAHWHPGPPVGPLGYDVYADINDDGAVDIFDIGIASAHWGQSW